MCRKRKFRGIIKSMGSVYVCGNIVHIRGTCVFMGNV